MHTTITFRPTYFQVAKDDVRLAGAVVTVDETSGKATEIRRLVVREEEAALESSSNLGPAMALA